MKTVFLGQSAPLDNAKSDPSVAINSGNNITLVHTEGDTMYHRFGSCRQGTVDWRGAVPIRSGSHPDVANTSTYVVVAFLDESSQPPFVHAIVGKYTSAGIDWTGDTLIDAYADRPSVAVNEAGKYVVAYEFESGMRYASGTTDGVTISLNANGQSLPNGSRPAIALNNHNEIALAYESGESIMLMTGTMDGAIIKTLTTREIAKGEDPSIGLTDDGLAIVTYRGDENALRQVCIQLANGMPSLIDERGYDGGGSSSVAVGGDVAIEVHVRSGKLVFANSIVTDRGTWMADRAAKLGGRPLKQLVLPASHDAGMYRVDEIELARLWVQTQSRRIHRQLEDGVRWFDLRLMRVKNHIVLHHGGWKGPRLAEVIEDIKTFIEAGRSELILLKFSSFKDFHASTWEHFATQMKALDSWMFKRSAAQGKRLADLTLSDYIANGSRVVALTTRGNPALSSEDYWLYRGDEEDSTAGDLRVFDHYTGTEDFNKMKDDQLDKFADYTGKCDDGSDCELFLFSWTLTPKDFQFTIIPPPIPPPSSVRALADKANPYLGQTVAGTPVPNGAGYIMNLLFVDFLQYARVSDVALYQMGAASV
jgi:hypothetical protein